MAAVLLRPLPYRGAGRPIEVSEKAPKKGVPRYFLSSDYYDLAERSRTLDHFAGSAAKPPRISATAHPRSR